MVISSIFVNIIYVFQNSMTVLLLSKSFSLILICLLIKYWYLLLMNLLEEDVVHQHNGFVKVFVFPVPQPLAKRI